MFHLRVFPAVFYHEVGYSFLTLQAFGSPMYELLFCCIKSFFEEIS